MTGRPTLRPANLSGSRTSRWRRAGQNLTLLAFGLLVSFLLIEGLLRVWNPFPFRVRADRIILPANFEYRVDGIAHPFLDSKVIHRKNSLGFRGAEPPRDLEHRVSIIAVGGSTTECFYLTDGKTWVDLIGARLERSVSRLWINNAGLDGHSTFGHIVLMRDHIADIKPKLTLFLVGANDIGTVQPRPSDRRNLAMGLDFSDARSLVYSLANASEVVSLALNLHRVWRAHAQGVAHTFAEEAAGDEADVAPADIRAPTAEELESYRARLRELLRVTRSLGTLPVLLTQPARDPIPPSNAAPQTRSAARGYRLDRYNDVVRDLATEENVGLIDLARTMPTGGRYFYDYFHFTNEGAAEVARIIAGPLCQLIRVQFPSYVARECAA